MSDRDVLSVLLDEIQSAAGSVNDARRTIDETHEPNYWAFEDGQLDAAEGCLIALESHIAARLADTRKNTNPS